MSGAPAATAGATAIRRAGPDDFPAIAHLLTQRDERTWDVPAVRWFVQELDPARCIGWIAWSGDRPIGLTSVYIRDLHVGTKLVRAAYWANLYIDPAFRDRMLYPRLPQAMFPELKAQAVRFTYAAVRRSDVAQAHRSIGFQPIGAWTVRVKPLRPLSLLGKLRNIRPLGALGAPFDTAFGALATMARPASGTTVEPLAQNDDATIATTVAALNQDQTPVHSHWDAARFTDRYARTREGGQYNLTAVRKEGALQGVVIDRLGERPPDLKVSVIMDAITTGDPDPLRGALGAAERRARAAGADAMLFLDSLGPAIGNVFRRSGYLATPERYELLVRPKEALTEFKELTSFENWRYSFGDHDAF